MVGKIGIVLAGALLVVGTLLGLYQLANQIPVARPLEKWEQVKVGHTITFASSDGGLKTVGYFGVEKVINGWRPKFLLGQNGNAEVLTPPLYPLEPSGCLPLSAFEKCTKWKFSFDSFEGYIESNTNTMIIRAGPKDWIVITRQ